MKRTTRQTLLAIAALMTATACDLTPLDIITPEDEENPDNGVSVVDNGNNENNGGNESNIEPSATPTTPEEFLAAIPEGYFVTTIMDQGAGKAADGSLALAGGSWSNSVAVIYEGCNIHEICDFSGSGLGRIDIVTPDTEPMDHVKSLRYSLESVYKVLNAYRQYTGPEPQEIGTAEVSGYTVKKMWADSTSTYGMGMGSTYYEFEFWIRDNGDCLWYSKKSTYTSAAGETGNTSESIEYMEYARYGAADADELTACATALEETPVSSIEDLPVYWYTEYTDTWLYRLYPSELPHQWGVLSYPELSLDDLFPPYTGAGKIIAMQIQRDDDGFFNGIHTLVVAVEDVPEQDARDYIAKIQSLPDQNGARFIESPASNWSGASLEYKTEVSSCDAGRCPYEHDPDQGMVRELRYDVYWNEKYYSDVAFSDGRNYQSVKFSGSDKSILVIQIEIIDLGCWY